MSATITSLDEHRVARQLETLAIELTVSQGERVAFTTQVTGHVRQALLALYQVQPDTNRAERYLANLAELALQEERRAAAAEWRPEPGGTVALARAA